MILLVCQESFFDQESFNHQGLKGSGKAILWSKIPASDTPVSVCIDMLFDNSTDRVDQLKNIQAEIVFVNLVAETSIYLPDNFIRINGWPGFWQRNVAECAAKNSSKKKLAEDTLSALGKTIEWTPDISGFISARIISAMINEAYFALGEGISSKEEIDLAMKTGTNYPYGPFQWSNLIGLTNIVTLLNKMAESDNSYLPAPLLIQEAQKI